MPGAAIGIIGLAVSAVGMGINYVSQQAAAATQQQIAAANFQTQNQQIQQSNQLSQMQSAINTALAAKDAAAAQNNASADAAQAESNSAAARESTRSARLEAARFAATQRAALAKGGFDSSTGSPLALLADTAQKSQDAANQIQFEDESQRRALFREGAAQKNEAILAGMRGTSAKAAGLAAAQSATAQAAQAKLDLYGQRASAAAARTNAGAGLFTAFGGLAGQAYTMFKPTPKVYPKTWAV